MPRMTDKAAKVCSHLRFLSLQNATNNIQSAGVPKSPRSSRLFSIPRRSNPTRSVGGFFSFSRNTRDRVRQNVSVAAPATDDGDGNCDETESDDTEHGEMSTLNKNGKPRKSRQKRAPLIRWDDHDIALAMIGIVWACGEAGVQIPFAQAAQVVETSCTASALQQAILKIKDRLVLQGDQIPKLRMGWPSKRTSPTNTNVVPRDFSKVSRRKPTLQQSEQSLIVTLKCAYRPSGPSEGAVHSGPSEQVELSGFGTPDPDHINEDDLQDDEELSDLLEESGGIQDGMRRHRAEVAARKEQEKASHDLLLRLSPNRVPESSAHLGGRIEPPKLVDREFEYKEFMGEQIMLATPVNAGNRSAACYGPVDDEIRSFREQYDLKPTDEDAYLFAQTDATNPFAIPFAIPFRGHDLQDAQAGNDLAETGLPGALDFPGNGYVTYTSLTQNYEVDKWLADHLASGISELNEFDIPFEGSTEVPFASAEDDFYSGDITVGQGGNHAVDNHAAGSYAGNNYAGTNYATNGYTPNSHLSNSRLLNSYVADNRTVDGFTLRRSPPARLDSSRLQRFNHNPGGGFAGGYRRQN
jgi:hypothetical protein